MDTLIVVLSAFVAGCAVAGLIAHLVDLNSRIKRLEEAQLAALNYILFDDDLKRERIDNAIAHFQAARNGKE